MADIEVSIDEPAVQPVISPPVVIPDNSAEVTAILIDHERRITALEAVTAVTAAVVEEVASDVENAQVTADVALDVAHDATSIAIDAEQTVEEVAEIAVATANETGVLPEVYEDVDSDLIPSDVTPRKTHILFASREELRTRLAN